MDAGDTSAVPPGFATDLAGRPRVQGRAVDLGAFEQPPGQSPVYEAERAAVTGAAVTGAAVSASHAGFTGTGFVDHLHAAGDAVEFTVQAPSAGVARRALVGGWGLIGSWLGVDRFKHAKDGGCTACTAAYRFGDGSAVVGRGRR